MIAKGWDSSFVKVLRYILQAEEARIAKEVEAHEKRIRKELEKQDILRKKVLLQLIVLPLCVFYFIVISLL